MKTNRYVKLIVALIIIIAATAVSCKVEESNATVNITLDRDIVSLVIGTQETLVATVTPNTNVKWTSVNSDVATVEDGMIRGVSVGRTVVNARAGNSTASCDVIVTLVPIPVTGITLQETELIMSKGDKRTVKYTVAPIEATNKRVTWSSSNSNIAAVHKTTGEITAVGYGEAVITATTVDGGKTAICTVYVVPSIELLSPGDKANLTMNVIYPGKQLTFTWKTFEEISKYVFKLSTTSNFATTIFPPVETTQGSVDISLDALNGALIDNKANPVQLYWTVEAMETTLKVSTETQTLNVFPDRREFLKFVPESAAGMQITEQDNSPYHYQVNMTGASSVVTAGLIRPYNPDSVVLRFAFKSNMEIPSVTVTFYKSSGAVVGAPVTGKALPQTDVLQEWSYWFDPIPAGWGAAGDYLKFDFGNVSAAQVQINEICFRDVNKQEYVPQIFDMGSFGPAMSELTRVSTTEFIMRVIGPNPNYNTLTLIRSLPSRARILRFEYKSDQDMKGSSGFQIYLNVNSVYTAVNQPLLKAAADWTTMEYDFTDGIKKAGFGAKGNALRIHPGVSPTVTGQPNTDYPNYGYILNIRNIRFEFK